MFTRKHYNIIANIIKKNWEAGTESCIAEDLADYFEDDNPNFDRDRFLTTCGVS